LISETPNRAGRYIPALFFSPKYGNGFLAFAGLFMLDALVTAIALRGGAIELNPLLGFGVWGLFIWKAVGLGALVYLAMHIPTRWAARYWRVWAVIFLMVDVWNMAILTVIYAN
jgi:uncharacterized protein DUF5658